MPTRRFPKIPFLAVQGVVVAALAVGYAATSPMLRNELRDELTGSRGYPAVPVPREVALRIAPLYDDPQVVSDDDLAAVLTQVLPRFEPEELQPNYVEHAVRAWGVDATFADPDVMPGGVMKDFLLDHGMFVQSWGGDRKPLLEPRPAGVAVRWGRDLEESAHHDHLLASLTEAGVRRDDVVYPPGRDPATVDDILQEALRDFDIDDREVEWSAMAFALWLPPRTEWRTTDGRRLDFDMLARRLVRGHKQAGVCLGTHRIYSLMLMWRLNEESGGRMLSPGVADEAYAFLETVRDAIAASQMPDGRWPSNWWDGARAAERAGEQIEHQQVIATGHHLEWLAIAPAGLHPPREQIRKAAAWLVANTTSKSREEILRHYTFYSHVGNALALWRGTRPAEFWSRRERGEAAPPPPDDNVEPPPPPVDLPPPPVDLPPLPDA